MVEMSSVSKSEFTVTYTLNVIEVIKGVSNKQLTFLNLEVNSRSYRQNDFNNHNDPDFWSKDIGRSKFPCCICGPAHTFKKGNKYLYFPDSLGAFKSAEIIKSSDDKWYKFVKLRVSRKHT